jgi:hypothetical protein
MNNCLSSASNSFNTSESLFTGSSCYAKIPEVDRHVGCLVYKSSQRKQANVFWLEIELTAHNFLKS